MGQERNSGTSLLEQKPDLLDLIRDEKLRLFLSSVVDNTKQDEWPISATSLFTLTQKTFEELGETTYSKSLLESLIWTNSIIRGEVDAQRKSRTFSQNSFLALVAFLYVREEMLAEKRTAKKTKIPKTEVLRRLEKELGEGNWLWEYYIVDQQVFERQVWEKVDRDFLTDFLVKSADLPQSDNYYSLSSQRLKNRGIVGDDQMLNLAVYDGVIKAGNFCLSLADSSRKPPKYSLDDITLGQFRQYIANCRDRLGENPEPENLLQLIDTLEEVSLKL